MECRTNEKILQMVNEKRSLIETIRKKPTVKMAGLRIERRLPTNSRNRRKNGGKEDERKTKNDATRLDGGGIQQVETEGRET